MSQNDPFEEFEFRPLTEGLGFHKKPTEISKPEAAAKSTHFELKNNLPEIEMPFASKSNSKIPSAPVENIQKNKSEVGQVNAILKTLQSKRTIEFQENKNSLKAPTQILYKSSFTDFSALLLDSMLVISASIACMIVLIMTTQIDLFAVLAQSQDVSLMIGLGLLFATCTWIYLTINRIFMGATPGEWVFDQCLGSQDQIEKSSYQLRVALRSTVVLFTGLIILPIFSNLLRRDLAGEISGVSLLKRV